jgi:hypothetical protein
MTITWHSVPDSERFFSASLLFWIGCKLLHFASSNDVMSPVIQWINCSILFYTLFSFFLTEKLISYFITGSIVYSCACYILKTSVKRDISFFCYVCYIVDYEIIEEAISRLKANLNKNRSSIIRKENSRSDLLFYEMKREKKELRHIRSSNVILFHFLFCYCFLFNGAIFIVYIYIKVRIS